MIQNKQTFTPLLQEDRTFTAEQSFVNQAHCKDGALHKCAEEDYQEYWQDRAKELDWFCAWDTVLDWQPPHCKWFVHGK